MLLSIRRGVYLLIVLCVAGQLHAETRHFRCKAADPHSGAVIFTCSGSEVRRGGKLVSASIRYRLPNGKLFARETINYRKDRFAPDLAFRDDRDGRREIIEKNPGGFSLLFQDSAKGTPDAHRLKYTDTSIPALTVPGLPGFIEQNWKTFTAGEKILFYCVFPLQRKLVRLRGQLEMTVSYRKQPALLMRMQPENFVYRWFSDPVYLTFLLKSKRLVRYQGLHYIRDPRTGGGSIVDLTFVW